MTIRMPAAVMAVANLIDLESNDNARARKAAGERVFARVGNEPAFAVQGATEDVAELTLYDEIGFFGITAAAFRMALQGITAKRIILSINSPGGDVFDGIAMHNDLAQHGAEVEVRVMGLAASAASVVAMAGDRILMAENAFLMIHNAWALAIGDHVAMREMGDTLEKIDGALAITYAGRADVTEAQALELMDAETWMGAEQALELGFADDILAEDEDGAAAAALFDLSAFANVPAQIKRQTESRLRDAGYSRRQAAAATAGGFGTLPRRDVEDDTPPVRDAGAVSAKAAAAIKQRTQICIPYL